MPEPIRNELWRAIAPHEWLIPGWCQKVTIYWDPKDKADPEDDDCSACNRSSYNYRRAALTFFPSFIGESPDEQRQMIIHEMLHTFSSVLTDWMRDTIERLLPKDDAPKFREAVLEELAARHESFVQDMAWSIAEKIGPATSP